MKIIRRIVLISVSLLIFALPACSPAAGGVSVSDAWARPSPGDEMTSMGGVNGGAFMTIRNNGSQPDTLIGAESSAARVVEIHETTMSGDVMRMQQVESLEIPAGGEVLLQPGGYHIMLIDLQQSLAPGDTIEITLVFQQAGRVTVSVSVSEN